MDSQLGMSRRVAAKKPFLKPLQIEKRKVWAVDHMDWVMTDWERIIWTDEASVEVGKESRECLVWRREGERYLQECLAPTFKSGRTSLMIWGCITYGKRGPLVRIPSNMRKGQDYVNLILSNHLWDFYLEMSEEKGVVLVMEDGAPSHRSKVAQNFRTENELGTISHPPQSPDMNPIEHVWKRLKTLVNQRPTRPQNLDELWVALQEEWLKIDVEFINSLIESMPRRVAALYTSKGRSTKY
jgi:transposase